MLSKVTSPDSSNATASTAAWLLTIVTTISNGICTSVQGKNATLFGHYSHFERRQINCRRGQNKTDEADGSGRDHAGLAQEKSNAGQPRMKRRPINLPVSVVEKSQPVTLLKVLRDDQPTQGMG